MIYCFWVARSFGTKMKPEVWAKKNNCLSAFSVIGFCGGVRMEFWVQVLSKNWLGIIAAYSFLKSAPQGLLKIYSLYLIIVTLQNLQFKLRWKENNFISTAQIKFECPEISRNTEDGEIENWKLMPKFKRQASSIATNVLEIKPCVLTEEAYFAARGSTTGCMFEIRSWSEIFERISPQELAACFQLLSSALETGQMTSIAPQNLHE